MRNLSYSSVSFSSLYLVVILVLTGTISACQTEEVLLSDQDAFIKIFDTPLAQGSIEPIDLTVVNDSTYLILASKAPENTTFYQTYLLAVSDKGDVLWKKNLDSKYVNPLSGIYTDVSGSYFYCMDSNLLGTYKLKVNSQNNEVEEVAFYENFTYPLSSLSFKDGSAVVQYYNRNTRATGVAKLNQDGSTAWSNEYPILEDKEPEIFSHMIGTGQKLPFFCQQQANGDLMVNGYYNYSMSLLFISGMDGTLQGSLFGNRYDSGISHAYHLGSESYALASFDPYQSYIQCGIPVATKSHSELGSYSLTNYSELDPDFPVFFQQMNHNANQPLLALGTTHAKQLSLMAFDQVNGTLLASMVKGAKNPYEAVRMVQTKDGGVAILTVTQVSGRFRRVGLFKLSNLELTEWLETGQIKAE